MRNFFSCTKTKRIRPLSYFLLPTFHFVAQRMVKSSSGSPSSDLKM